MRVFKRFKCWKRCIKGCICCDSINSNWINLLLLFFFIHAVINQHTIKQKESKYCTKAKIQPQHIIILNSERIDMNVSESVVFCICLKGKLVCRYLESWRTCGWGISCKGNLYVYIGKNVLSNNPPLHSSAVRKSRTGLILYFDSLFLSLRFFQNRLLVSHSAVELSS